jgi:hypothetical protein
MSNLNFNAYEVEPQESFEPIPAGWYKVMITDSEMKDTKNGNGRYLQLRLDVIEGEHENRVLFERLNLENPNQTAVDIAQRTLSAICRAVGVMQPEDSSDLHDRPLMAKVSVRPASGGYEANNDIKAYSAVEDGSSTPKAETASKPAAPARKARKPWE